MRSSLVSVLLGLSIAATGCTVGEFGDGGGGGGGGGGGDGDGGGGPDAPSAVPKVDATVDKLTINTELRSTSMVTVSFQASGGFSGPVNLTASVVNAADAPIPGWTVALDTSTVNLAADGTATAVATLTVPSENRGLAGTIKIDATSSVGTVTLTSAVTVLNQLTIPVSLNNGQCVYPPAGTITMTVGSKIRFMNTATDDNITIHVNNGGDADTTPGVPHQSDPGSAPGTAYERTLTGLVNTGDGTFSWYCHAPGPDIGGLKIKPVAAR